MMSTTTSRAVLALAVTVTLAALVGVGLNDPRIPVPRIVADGLRLVVMAEASFCVGMMSLLVVRGTRVRLDKGDELTRPAFGWLLAFAMLCVFAILQMATLINLAALTYRTPLAFASLTTASVCLWRITSRLGRMVDKARWGTLKLTITDTSRPGPDIDLGTGGPVTPPADEVAE